MNKVLFLLAILSLALVSGAASAQSGDWYVALSGTKVHGAAFVDQVVAAGARAILTDAAGQSAAAATGLPVVSSNLALIWHMLRLAGIDAAGWAPGRPCTSAGSFSARPRPPSAWWVSCPWPHWRPSACT